MGCCSDICGKTTCAQRCGFEGKENQIGIISSVLAIGAIAHMTIGILALYGVVPTSTALYTQIGFFALGATTIAGTLALSTRIKKPGSKAALFISTLAILSIPVIFGALGAQHIIHPHSMLYASTAIGGGIVLSVPLFGGSVIGKNCCDDDK